MEDAVHRDTGTKPVEFVLLHHDHTWSTAIVQMPCENVKNDADWLLIHQFKDHYKMSDVLEIYIWSRNPKADHDR